VWYNLDILGVEANLHRNPARIGGYKMAQKYTEARKDGNRKWDAANLDRLSVAVPKGQKDVIKAHADSQGESVNAFISRAIAETMERDNAGD
jgi:predicted HicB family RNase H-like nuclease